MRKRHTRLPSPAMAVAFLALLTGLAGTAVALPGKNSVGIDDMRSNSVGKAELRTGSVGKAEILSRAVGAAEVINNSLGGADVNEGSLGTVPRANAANSAGTAGLASFAGLAARTNGVQIARQVGAAEDTRALILSAGGFQIILNCDNDISADGTQTIIRNVSAGNNSHMDDNLEGDEENDFDAGDEATLANDSSTDNIENSAYSAIGSAGSAIHGQSAVVSEPDFPGAPDCVGSATAFGS